MDAAPPHKRDLFGLLTSALLVALVIAVSAVALHERTVGPPPEPGAHQTPEALWVIPPAREQAIEALLAPLLEGSVGDRRFDHFRVDRDTIHVLQQGEQPDGEIEVSLPSGELRLRWVGEGPAPANLRALETQIRSRYQDDIWLRRTVAPNPREQVREGRFGILTPACDATGLDPYLLLLLTFVLGLGIATAGGFLAFKKEGDPPRAPREASSLPYLIGLVVLGVALRLWLAHSLPIESDELAPSLQTQLFDSGHDAWLHPPVFRALQIGWLRLIGWGEGGAAFAFRAPSLFFGIGALVMMALALRRERPILREVVLVALTFGPDLATNAVRARPYALALFLSAVAIAAVWDRTSWPRARGLRAFVAVVAIGLLFFTDLLFGFALTAALGALALFRSGSVRRARVIAGATVLAGALWAVPLAPGAYEALRTPTLEQHRRGQPGDEESVQAGQRPERGMGRGEPITLAGELSALAIVGSAHRGTGLLILLLLVVGCGLALWKGPREAAVALLIALGIALVVGSLRSIRPRNVLFLAPLGSLFLIGLGTTVSRMRRPQSSGSSE